MRIAKLIPRPLRHGCVVEQGVDETEILATVADATCRHLRLSLQGTITRAASGRIHVEIRADLYGRGLYRSIYSAISHGRWKITLILPGVNQDPDPPLYTITAIYPGSIAIAAATRTRRIALEAERAGL
jgi:hypothetical protein